jgi:hypothetical protein
VGVVCKETNVVGFVVIFKGRQNRRQNQNPEIDSPTYIFQYGIMDYIYQKGYVEKVMWIKIFLFCRRATDEPSRSSSQSDNKHT